MLLTKAGRAELVPSLRDDHSPIFLAAFLSRRVQFISVSHGLPDDADTNSRRR